MDQIPADDAYIGYVQSLKQQHTAETAMHLAVGGHFEVVGILERELLIQNGLEPHHYLVDVGCGSGRLAQPLAAYLKGRYLGTDVVPDLVEHARRHAGRPEWRFEVTNGIQIPERDDQADMVCFFSVFTHLLHEQSFVYLEEAKRVLKPGGTIVFSFLEFAINRHWEVFESNLAHRGGEQPLNMFMSRDGIAAWARHLDLRIVAIHDGNVPHIPLPQPVFYDDHLMEDAGYLGQSVCVLRKRSHLINTI